MEDGGFVAGELIQTVEGGILNRYMNESIHLFPMWIEIIQ